MRSSSAAKSTVTARRTSPTTTKAPLSRTGLKPAVKAPVQLPSIDEKDDYIMNLKGQVYLLTIENEMMKKSMISEAGPQQQQQQSMMYQQHLGHQPGLATLSPQHQLGSASMPRPRDAAPPTMHSMNASSILLASDLPAASYPTEINDAFEVMRQKYAQLDHKYQHDVDEARRAAEALASQCAAQSSLITTLKKEVEAANENLSEQKNIAQAVDQRSAVDLEKATNDIGQLQGRIQELSETLEIRDRKIEDMYHEVAKLKSDRVLAEGEREGADRARAKALVQLGLQNGICKVLVRKWQEAKMTINHLAADLQKIKADKNALQGRMDRAESEAAEAFAAADAAKQIRDKAFERATTVQVQLDEERAETARLNLIIADKDAVLAELHALVERLQRSSEVAENERYAADCAREHASKKIERYQSSLTQQTKMAEDMRSLAHEAERKEQEATVRAKALEEELAEWHARAKSLEHSQKQQERSISQLNADLETVGQQLATSEREVTQLRDELARRPPIDVIKNLDVENLLQRNVQAAAAMHQLLAWQEQNASMLSSHGGNPAAVGSGSA